MRYRRASGLDRHILDQVYTRSTPLLLIYSMPGKIAMSELFFTIPKELVKTILLNTTHNSLQGLRLTCKHFSLVVRELMTDPKWWYQHLAIRGIPYTGSHPLLLALIFDYFSHHQPISDLYGNNHRCITRLETLFAINVPDITLFMIKHGHTLYIEFTYPIHSHIRQKKEIYHTALDRISAQRGSGPDTLTLLLLKSTAARMQDILPLPKHLALLEAECLAIAANPLYHCNANVRNNGSGRELPTTYGALSMLPPDEFIGLAVTCRLPVKWVRAYCHEPGIDLTLVIRALISNGCYSFVESFPKLSKYMKADNMTIDRAL